MIDVITPAFGRPEVAALCWPEVRSRAGSDIFWTIVITPYPFQPDVDAELAILAHRYADAVLIIPQRVSNGCAIELALEQRRSETLIKIDADIIPSPRWVIKLLRDEKRWQNGRLGAISALPPNVPRFNVGPRKTWQAWGKIVLYTSLGMQAIDDHSQVRKLHGDHDAMVARQLAIADLDWVYTHNVWWVWHDERNS